MPCRIGIATDHRERHAYWRTHVYGLRNWRVVATCRTRREAREYVDRYARNFGCRICTPAAGGGGPWHVYRFDYTRERP